TRKAGNPSYKSTWKVSVGLDSQRIAIADVTGDKSPRLLILDKKNVLTVYKITGNKTEEEGTINLGAKGSKFVVGRFSKDKPAMIVSPGTVYYFDNGMYAKKSFE